MGFNTTVLILNDAVHQIKEDPKFGENLAEAIYNTGGRGKSIDISIGNHANGARVIESHHADITKVIMVGGNYAQILCESAGGWNLDAKKKEDVKEILRAIADEHGLRVAISDKK